MYKQAQTHPIRLEYTFLKFFFSFKLGRMLRRLYEVLISPRTRWGVNFFDTQFTIFYFFRRINYGADRRYLRWKYVSATLRSIYDASECHQRLCSLRLLSEGHYKSFRRQFQRAGRIECQLVARSPSQSESYLVSSFFMPLPFLFSLLTRILERQEKAKKNLPVNL